VVRANRVPLRGDACFQFSSPIFRSSLGGGWASGWPTSGLNAEARTPVRVPLPVYIVDRRRAHRDASGEIVWIAIHWADGPFFLSFLRALAGFGEGSALSRRFLHDYQVAHQAV